MAMAKRRRLSDVNTDGVNYFMEKLAVQIFKHFDEQNLVDVTFKLSNPGALITAHRLILSAASPYFREFLKSEAGLCPLIEITDIDSDTFECLITFCYTGKTLITPNNVEKMLTAALILKLEEVVENCADFLMKNITECTLQRAYKLFSETQCEVLNPKILQYEMRNLMSVIQSKACLNFNAKKLQTIIENDKLPIKCEKDVFDVIMRWYKHDVPGRKQNLPDLIGCLRLTQFDSGFIMSNILSLPGCHNIASQALTWLAYPPVRSKLTLKYTKQREGQITTAEESFLALNLTATVHNGQIYILCGGTETVERYDPQRNEWSKICSLRVDFHGISSTSFGNNLWAVGGHSADVSVYDQQNNKWIAKRNLPSTVGASHVRIILTGTMAMAKLRCLSDEYENTNGVNYFMEKLADEQNLVDVTFKLSNPGALITAHRLILSAASPYFREFLKSEAGLCPLIEITDIDSNTFERLIVFCYTGKTLITPNNVEKMLKAALILKLDEVVENCADFLMKNITECTLQRAYKLFSETQCEVLNHKILQYELRNLMSVLQSNACLNFNAKKLQTIIENDKLPIKCEKDVFDVIMRWYKHDIPGRKQNLPDLIGCLRLTQFDSGFITSNILSLPGCDNIASQALTWLDYPSVRSKLTLTYTKQREGQITTITTAEESLLALDLKSGTIYQYHTTEDLSQKLCDIKIYFNEFAVIFMNENLIFTGGSRYGSETNEVRCWNFKAKAFQDFPSMNVSRAGHSVVILNEKIYVIGGYNGTHLKSVEMYSVSNGWQQVTDMLRPRCKHTAVALDNKIYVMGGGNSLVDALKCVDCYNSITNRWTECAPLIQEHLDSSATVHNGQIYILCGGTETVERYDPQRNEWSKICSLRVDFQGISSTSFGNNLWAVGGHSADVSVYDQQNNKWIAKRNLPSTGKYYCFTVPKALLT